MDKNQTNYCPKYKDYVRPIKCNACKGNQCQEVFCLVVGSRGFDDYVLFASKLNELISGYDKVAIVSGGARGADALAKKFAKDNNLRYYEFKADWSLGKKAGYIRNEQMHKFISHFDTRLCIAFWDGKSKGTTHSFDLAKKYSNPIEIVRVDF